jgi:two-component system, OmpR family, sensor histidine kinase VicK
MNTVQAEQFAAHAFATASRPDFAGLDRSPDPALDELAEFAAVLCGAEFAYIGFLDGNRLWFKSRHGFHATEQAHGLSACQWTVQAGAPLLIHDASQDSRFPPDGIALPGARPCRSYAGVPLAGVSEEAVGTLAVLSEAPNRFNEEHLHLLETLGRQVATRLELYNRISGQEQAQRARQRMERALAIERSFAAATLDTIPALIVVLDTAGRVVRLNYPCMKLTGVSLADAVGRPFVEELLQDVDRGWAAGKLREAAAGQVSGPHETGWRTQGKRSCRVSWTLRPLSGPGDDVQYLILAGQDVTDQRRMEQALLSSETRYRQLVENSLGFLFTCTLEGRLTSLNAFTAETLGYRIEDLTGRSVAEFLDPAGVMAFREGMESLETGKEWQGTLRVRRSDGAYRHIAFRSRRMELPGHQAFVLNHGMDMTEQQDAEEAMQRATRQRELILQAVGDGIYGIDLDGRLNFMNEAAAQMLGYAPGQLASRDIHALIHHSHADGTSYSKITSPVFQAMRERKQIRVRDEVFRRKDGTAFPVEYSASPLIENGQVSGMVVAFQDVSERRRLDRMKDEFISTVSHELRTPLTSLRASLGLFSSGMLDSRPDRQRQMVQMAVGNCDRLVRLVNGILDFERLEKGRLSLNRKPLEAAGLLRKASDAAYGAAVKARIEFRIDADLVTVLADEDRILQVLNELVSNAIKFSPPETKVRLAAHLSSPNEACFSVEDQGRGIPPEKLDKIFDRFQQGDGSDSRELGGTGLGLALCRSLVEQHGGRIWAESEPGQGARLKFTLPRVEGAQ